MRYDHTGSCNAAPARQTSTSGALSSDAPGCEQAVVIAAATAPTTPQRNSARTRRPAREPNPPPMYRLLLSSFVQDIPHTDTATPRLAAGSVG